MGAVTHGSSPRVNHKNPCCLKSTMMCCFRVAPVASEFSRIELYTPIVLSRALDVSSPEEKLGLEYAKVGYA